MMVESQRPSNSKSTDPVPSEIENAPQIGVPVTGQGELAQARALELSDHHSKFADFEEEYVRHYINLADTKATGAFTVSSGVLAYLFGTTGFLSALTNPEFTAAYVVPVSGVFLLVLSAFFSFLVIAPRLTSPSGEDIVFFGAVASRKNANEYLLDIARHSSGDIIRARLKHCFDVSQVCARKYYLFNKAVWLGLPGLVGTLLFFFLH